MIRIIRPTKVSIALEKQFSANILKTIINKKKLSVDEMILMISPTKVLFELKLSDNSLLELLKQVSDVGSWEPLV